MKRPSYDFLDNGGEIKLFAHRGGDLAGPEKENSMAAFESAYRAGYRYFETDVVASGDDYVLATHGAKDEKTAKKTGLPLRKKLENMDYREILRTERIGGEPIPLLEEVLLTFPDIRINIDAKTQKVVKPLADLILRTKSIDRVCIASFAYRRTKEVAELLGGQDRVCTATAKLGFIAAKNMLPPFIAYPYLRSTKAACLQVPLRIKDLLQKSNEADENDRLLTTKKMIDNAQDTGLEVHVWTVNDEASMKKSVDLGVDGIMSDNLRDLMLVGTDYKR